MLFSLVLNGSEETSVILLFLSVGTGRTLTYMKNVSVLRKKGVNFVPKKSVFSQI